MNSVPNVIYATATVEQYGWNFLRHPYKSEKSDHYKIMKDERVKLIYPIRYISNKQPVIRVQRLSTSGNIFHIWCLYGKDHFRNISLIK